MEEVNFAHLVSDCCKKSSKVLNLGVSDTYGDKLNETTASSLNIDLCTHLEELDLTSHKFKTIPSFVSKCTNLKKLVMNRNEINEPPKEWISKCTQLEDLQLRFNSISTWPVHIHKLPCLSSLNLGYNSLKDISFGLFQNLGSSEVLSSLTSLDLSSNYLNSFPIRITRMPNLITLILNNNQIRVLSTQIGKLTKLSEFGISQCDLKELPICMTDMKLTNLNLSNNEELVLNDGWNTLVELDVSHCQLTSIASLYKTSTLKKLNASLNKIKDIGNTIQWTNLVELDISKNNLVQLGQHFGSMSNLQLLNASHNEIVEISSLPTTLTKLFLSNNKLTTMDYCKDLIHLKEVNLSTNDITQCNWKHCTKLESCNMSNNHFTTIKNCFSSIDLHTLEASDNHIVDSIVDMKLPPSIRLLDLSHNFVTSLEGIDSLVALESLDMSFNEITILPSSITSLSKLIYFSMTQNSLDFLILKEEIQQWITKNNMKFSNHFEIPDEIIQGVYLGSFVTASNRPIMTHQ
jgi:Leucine-rich repeat (LRR) protein